MSHEQLDCFLRCQGDIGPISLIKMISIATSQLHFTSPSPVFNVWKGIVNCHETTLSPKYVELLENFHLVWYKSNKDGASGLQFEDSYNYKLSEFKDELLSGSPYALSEVKGTIDNLKSGLTDSVHIVTIRDTALNKGLILDGTKRILALLYLRSKHPEIYNCLNFSRFPIKWCKVDSPVARIFYPIDFHKLVE